MNDKVLLSLLFNLYDSYQLQIIYILNHFQKNHPQRN